MFELVDSSTANTGEVVIFDDELLQGKFNKIRAIFDIKGYPSERRVDFRYRSLEYSPSEQMKDVPSDDESVLSEISSKSEVLQHRINELNADEQGQVTRINELKGTIEQHNERYAAALVQDNNALIQQIEDNIAECEAGIKKAERRKGAISEARRTIAQYHEITRVMWGVLDNREREKLGKQAKEAFLQELAVFAEHVEAYRTVRRDLKLYGAMDRDIASWIRDKLALRV